MTNETDFDKTIPDHFLDRLFSIRPNVRGDIKKELDRVADILEKADQEYPDAPLMQKVMQMVFANLPKNFVDNGEKARFEALQTASEKIALHIDTVNKEDRPAFHNRMHFILVQLCGRVIDKSNDGRMKVVRLSSADRACTAVIDLLHDLDHDGSNNGFGASYSPMRLENIALERAMPILEAIGTAEEDVSHIVSSVRATDPNLPKEIMHKVYRYHFGDRDVDFTTWDEKVCALQDETCKAQLNKLKKDLLVDPKLAFMAARMGDADLFASFGLSQHRADCETIKLNLEFLKNKIGPLCDSIGKPLPQGRLYGLLKMMGNHLSSSGELEVNFTTPGAEYLGGDCAREFQFNAEHALGTDETAKLYEIVGISTRPQILTC